MAVEMRARRVIFLVVPLFMALVVLGVKVLGISGVSGVSGVCGVCDSVCSGWAEVSTGASKGVSVGVDAVTVLTVLTAVVLVVVFGGVTVVTILVITVGLGLGSGVGFFSGVGSLMMPSHSSPLVSAGISGDSGTPGVSEASEVSGISSAKLGFVVEIEQMAVEPIKIRVKNNLTNRFIIF